jgi:hypothetical protein
MIHRHKRWLVAVCLLVAVGVGDIFTRPLWRQLTAVFLMRCEIAEAGQYIVA